MGPMRHLRPTLFLVVVLAALLPACGSTSIPGVPDSVFRSLIAITLDPTPLPAKVSTTAIGYLNISYKIVVTESSGLGGEFIFVNSTVFDDASGLSVAVNNYDASDLTVFVGTKRIEGNKSAEIGQQIDYLLPTGSTAARLAVNVQLRDDRGNVINQSILVPITPVPGPVPTPVPTPTP
jgi:hypothetical protein